MTPRILHMPQITKHAEEKLLAGGDPRSWENIKADIIAGHAQLFLCPDDTYMVLRIDRNDLVFVALVGSGAVPLVDLAIQIARAHGLKSVRFHTAHKGVPRLLKQFNPYEVNRVYRIDVL